MMRPALGGGARLGHFTVIDGLGAGGMGEVYRAFDERLKREVALKVLPRDLMDDPVARARLLREARSAASLNHPHICTVYDVGEDAGRYYIAMELVAGRPLDESTRAGALTAGAVIRLGAEIADSLEHAHEHGVIHRDLKSANVMLTPDGRAKVMDFGLARRVATAESETSAAAGTVHTEPGAIVGTTHYMAPEVLLGGEATPRADIWALGAVLHEMAAGELPFVGQTTYEVAAAIMHADPRPLPDSVPAGLRAIVARCLEKEPGRRYQHAGEVRAALEAIGSAVPVAVTPSSEPRPRQRSRPRRPEAPARPLEPWQITAIAIGVVVVAAAIIIRFIIPPTLKPSGLAVIPLVNLSNDPDQDYFAEGMTEEISTRLAKIEALRLIAPNSVRDLLRKQKSLHDIGRALNVPVLLHGSVMRTADRVRITVQLIRAASGEQEWAESYERSMLDVIALQSEVALAIARQIKVKLTEQEHVQLAASRQIDREAYEAYLRGRAVWNKYTLEAFQEAERHFRHAIDLAPDYAPAWSGLADAIYGMSSIYRPPNDVIPRAREAAAKALALDGSLAEAHTSIGTIKMVFDWDWAGAEQEFDRAIALKPGDANAHLWRGKLLVCTGRFEDGLADIRKALDLDPLSSLVSANLAWFLYYSRRHDQALAQVRKAMAADPDYGFFHFMHGLMLEQTGDHAGAVAALEKAMAIDANPESFAQLTHAYATAGRRADAERTLARLLEMRAQRFVPAADVAYAYAGLGEKDKAFQQLDSALVDHSEMLTLIGVDPGLDPLRSDPRFNVVLRRIGLVR